MKSENAARTLSAASAEARTVTPSGAIGSRVTGLDSLRNTDRLEPNALARLASSRWSNSTGWAFHPQGPDERFQGIYDITPSSPKLAWRNRIDRRIRAVTS